MKMNYSHDNDHCSDGGGGGQKYNKSTIKHFLPIQKRTEKNSRGEFAKAKSLSSFRHCFGIH